MAEIRCAQCSFDNRAEAKRCAGCGAVLMDRGVGYSSQKNPVASFGSAAPTAFGPGAAGTVIPGAGGGAKGTVLPQTGGYGAGGVGPTVIGGGAPPTDLGRPQGGGRRTEVALDLKAVAGWLVVLRSATEPAYRDIPIFRDRNLIGRAAPDPRQCVSDGRVSGQHLLLVANDAGVVLTDLGTPNGTAVNNQPVSTIYLAGGERIKIGGTTLVYVPVPAAPVPPQHAPGRS